MAGVGVGLSALGAAAWEVSEQVGSNPPGGRHRARAARGRSSGADALHPGWSFAEHVGYSTPEHRDAILRMGVSPLHRMSFQSLAYQQLAL